MEPEASKLPKGLVLGRDENIHIRLIESTPLSDVGCYNFPCVLAIIFKFNFFLNYWKSNGLDRATSSPPQIS